MYRGHPVHTNFTTQISLILTRNDGIFGMAALKPNPNPVKLPGSNDSRLGAAAATVATAIGFDTFSALPGSVTSTENDYRTNKKINVHRNTKENMRMTKINNIKSLYY